MTVDLNTLLSELVANEGSDLHVKAGEPPVRRDQTMV
jgi:Tfp pilus assembly pilus retraction ATPase PilT